MPAANSLEAGNLTQRGAGRPKGAQSKTTKLLKDAIILAAEQTGEDMNGKAGLVGYCRFLASTEPKAFSVLLGKVMPTQVTGEDGDAIKTVTTIVLQGVAANDKG